MIADTVFGPPLRTLNLVAPEGGWKNRLRATALRLRNGLPREVMVRRGDQVVQVGMWRRRNLLRLSRCVGPRGSVLLIEADPRVVADLEAFKREQALENVTIVNKGAYSEPGELKFQVAGSPGHNRLGGADVEMLNEKNRDIFQQEVVIPVDRVDDIIRDAGVSRVDYVEITVNGLEQQVLEGMPQALTQVRRVFVAGYARTGDGTPTNRVTESILRESGFQTIITRRTPPTQEDFDPRAQAEWGLQEGHVFAWR